jgi:hypothetical protein
MLCLERWAAERQIPEGWVGTDLARGFYERCGWTFKESFASSTGQRMSVLHKKFRQLAARDRRCWGLARTCRDSLGRFTRME